MNLLNCQTNSKTVHNTVLFEERGSLLFIMFILTHKEYDKVDVCRINSPNRISKNETLQV